MVPYNEKAEKFAILRRYTSLASAYLNSGLDDEDTLELESVAKFCKMEVFTNWSQVQEADYILALIDYKRNRGSNSGY